MSTAEPTEDVPSSEAGTDIAAEVLSAAGVQPPHDAGQHDWSGGVRSMAT